MHPGLFLADIGRFRFEMSFVLAVADCVELLARGSRTFHCGDWDHFQTERVTGRSHHRSGRWGTEPPAMVTKVGKRSREATHFANDSLFEDTGHPENSGFAHATFPSASFTVPQETCGTSMGIESQPRSVIGCEDDESGLVQLEDAKSLENPTDGRIDLFDDVTVDSSMALVDEIG